MGVNYHMCRYGMCHILGCLFRAENKFWGIIFGKITKSHRLLGLVLKNNSLSSLREDFTTAHEQGQIL